MEKTINTSYKIAYIIVVIILIGAWGYFFYGKIYNHGYDAGRIQSLDVVNESIKSCMESKVGNLRSYDEQGYFFKVSCADLAKINQINPFICPKDTHPLGTQACEDNKWRIMIATSSPDFGKIYKCPGLELTPQNIWDRSWHLEGEKWVCDNYFK